MASRTRKQVWLKRFAVAAALLVVLGFVALEALRFAAGRAGVREVVLPIGSEIEQIATGADYVDAYRAPLGCSGLSIASLMPVNAERETVRTASEVVYRGTAPGLHYFASYILEPPEDPTRFVLATAVFYDSVLGSIYFTPVKQVHRRAVPFAVSIQAKGWCKDDR